MAGGHPSCGSKNSLFLKSARTPASLLPALLGAVVGKGPARWGSGRVGGQLQARSGPACTLRAPGVGKRTIADPQSPEPSESPARAFLPSSSKFSGEAGRVQNRGPGVVRRRAARAGGTGSGLGVPRTPRRESGGWPFIATRGPSAPTPAPAGLRVAGNQQQKAPLVTWRAPPHTRTPIIPPLPLFSACPLQTLGGRRGKGLVVGPSQPLRPARPPRLLPSLESQTQRRGSEPRTPRREASRLPAPRTHPI